MVKKKIIVKRIKKVDVSELGTCKECNENYKFLLEGKGDFFTLEGYEKANHIYTLDQTKDLLRKFIIENEREVEIKGDEEELKKWAMVESLKR